MSVFRLVPISDVFGSGVGVSGVRSLTFWWKLKNGVAIGSSMESESEGLEGFLFLPIPLLLPSLSIRLRRFDFHWFVRFSRFRFSLRFRLCRLHRLWEHSLSYIGSGVCFVCNTIAKTGQTRQNLHAALAKRESRSTQVLKLPTCEKMVAERSRKKTKQFSSHKKVISMQRCARISIKANNNESNLRSLASIYLRLGGQMVKTCAYVRGNLSSTKVNTNYRKLSHWPSGVASYHKFPTCDSVSPGFKALL